LSWGHLPGIGGQLLQELGVNLGRNTHVESDGIYYAYMEWMVDKCPIWRVLSNVLLDIPLINVGSDIMYFDDWWTGDFIELELKPHYDHMMFVFFPSYYYDQATPERQDWYWEDMLSP
jgi:hypothetical protein